MTMQEVLEQNKGPAMIDLLWVFFEMTEEEFPKKEAYDRWSEDPDFKEVIREEYKRLMRLVSQVIR